MDEAKRDGWLDALRGVAVLLVLGRHLDLPADAHPLLALWQRGGWVGVDLFFVLSGFLISGLLFREYRRQGSFSVPRFLVRRGFRIYPPFVVLIAGACLVSTIWPVPAISTRSVLGELLFVQNYCRGVWPHTWSLAVEEHFYLGLPLVLVILARAGRGKADPFRPLVPIGVAVMVALVALRSLNYGLHAYSNRTHLFPSHLRADSLLAGVLLAYACHFHRATLDRLVGVHRRLLCVAGIACFVSAFAFDPQSTWFISTLGLPLFALGAVLLIAGSLGCPCVGVARLLAPIGRCSYSIYLWHYAVLLWAMPLLERAAGTRLDEPIRLPAYLGGSLLVGALMAALVERPALWLRERWCRRETALQSCKPSIARAA